MGKVYRHKPGALDEYLGRVEPESGKVYLHRRGPDEYVGRAELDSGKVYRYRHGPDEYLGHVHLDNGEIYSHRLGLDRYVARVKSNGHIYGHKSSPSRQTITWAKSRGCIRWRRVARRSSCFCYTPSKRPRSKRVRTKE
jgi:hypothetical protein